jgi:hypothetical protein
MKPDLYVKSLLTLAVALLAFIAVRLPPATVHAAVPSKYEVAWFSPGSNYGEDATKDAGTAYLQKMINDEAKQGWEYVGEISHTHVGNSIVSFLVFKK